MKINGILETSLYVNDLTIAEKFYTEVLKLKVLSKKEDRHVFLACENSMLLLFNPKKTLVEDGKSPKHGTTGSGHIAFSINEKDYDEWKSYLMQKSVEIEKEVNWEKGGKSIYFRDPSGNSLELVTLETWKI